MKSIWSKRGTLSEEPQQDGQDQKKQAAGCGCPVPFKAFVVLDVFFEGNRLCFFPFEDTAKAEKTVSCSIEQPGCADKADQANKHKNHATDEAAIWETPRKPSGFKQDKIKCQSHDYTPEQKG